MRLIIYQVDAFTNRLFAGNPAAVCPLENWLLDKVLQNIAAENNLSETAFFVKTEAGFDLRWFTPTMEVDLCGHATLASAHVLFQHLNYEKEEIVFHSKSGKLSVAKEGDFYSLNFPTDQLQKVETPSPILEAFQIEVEECFLGREDYLVIVKAQDIVENLRPDFQILTRLKGRGTIVSAPGKEVDFVSRCFFPNAGINEDPVTGSAHTSLTPYWAQRLDKEKLIAKQISQRGGDLKCELMGERVAVSGQALTYLTGEIMLS